MASIAVSPILMPAPMNDDCFLRAHAYFDPAHRTEIGDDRRRLPHEMQPRPSAGRDDITLAKAVAAPRKLVGDPHEPVERITERAGARALAAHNAADRKRDLVPSQVKLFPSVDRRADDEAAVKAIVRDDLLDPRGLPVVKPRVAKLDYRRYRSDGVGDLGALVWNAARRQAVAHRERELGFDADREEIARRNFRRRIEASRREDTRREGPGRSDQRLRLLRGASDFVAGDWQAALSDEGFLDRIGVVQRQRRAARRQPFDRPPAAARGGDRGHRFFEIVRRYHLHSMRPAVPPAP